LISNIQAWTETHNGIIPNIQLVVMKEEVFEANLLTLQYSHYNEHTLTFQGGNDYVTLKVDPFSGNMYEMDISNSIPVYSDSNSEFGVDIETYIGGPLVGLDMGFYAQYKPQDDSRILASTNTSLGYDILGDAVFCYENGVVSETDPEININTVIEMRAPTKDIILGGAAVVSLGVALSYAPQAAPAVVGKLADLVQGALATGVTLSPVN
jgi:hypothetical protein